MRKHRAERVDKDGKPKVQLSVWIPKERKQELERFAQHYEITIADATAYCIKDTYEHFLKAGDLN